MDLQVIAQTFRAIRPCTRVTTQHTLPSLLGEGFHANATSITRHYWFFDIYSAHIVCCFNVENGNKCAIKIYLIV